MGFLGTPTSSPKSLALSREHTGELAKHSKEPDSVKLVGKARGNETTMLVFDHRSDGTNDNKGLYGRCRKT